MSTAKRLHYSYEDYLDSLERGDLKLEYCDGVIYAMAGGTRAHAELAAAVILALGRGLPTGCRLATSDLKVRVEATGLTTFPDVSVVCGEAVAPPEDRHAISNPTILVEVTSRSTEDYDRGDKLSHYKQLPSLRAVLLVSHRTHCVTVVERTTTGWSERDVRGSERVELQLPAVSFAVDDVYQGISLEP